MKFSIYDELEKRFVPSFEETPEHEGIHRLIHPDGGVVEMIVSTLNKRIPPIVTRWAPEQGRFRVFMEIAP